MQEETRPRRALCRVWGPGVGAHLGAVYGNEVVDLTMEAPHTCASLATVLATPDVLLMYDGSAAFDLPDAIYLGRALEEAKYLWYEEPMREFSFTPYKQLSQAVRVPLLVGETSDGAHMNIGDFIATGMAPFVRTSAALKGGITGAMCIAHLADDYRLRAEVHGSSQVNRHLCMAIPNNTYYESLIMANPVVREAAVDAQGFMHAPAGPGMGFEADRLVDGLPLPWHL